MYLYVYMYVFSYVFKINKPALPNKPLEKYHKFEKSLLPLKYLRFRLLEYFVVSRQTGVLSKNIIYQA